jgi:hypothetical protein
MVSVSVVPVVNNTVLCPGGCESGMHWSSTGFKILDSTIKPAIIVHSAIENKNLVASSSSQLVYSYDLIKMVILIQHWI